MSKKNTIHQEDIAIIGMACVFPQAPDIKTFWRNILGSVDAVSEPLPEWEAERYLASGRIKTSYGGYLKDLYRFNPKEFGIMPNSVDGGEPDQFLALRTARDALQDAGYLDSDHRNTGIVLGHSTYLHRGQGNLIQHNIVLDQTMELLKAVLPSPDINLSEIRSLLESKLPPFNADIVSGLVPNIMTGRIANRLNLNGPNYLIDAACSSSLLAVSAAMDELRSGRSRMMLAGGVNASLPAEVSVIFTQLGALSESGRIRPFGAGSDGTLLGEGLGVIVLKRVSDAIADCDRIYAVIHSIGQASDGKGHGLLAPSVEGEALAIERAYKSSGIDPGTIGLVEAHGTGIALGDQTEIAALKQIFGNRKGAQGSIAIGSIKSMIGHCIPAAGIAGMIKTVLALHHKVLPPTICETVSPDLDLGSTPFYVNTTARPWISQTGTPRRAGINSFGFGGINTHAILEEAPKQESKPLNFSAWPVELFVFSGENIDDLKAGLNQVAELIEKNGDLEIGDIAAALVARNIKSPYRLAMVAKDSQDLEKKIEQALKRLDKNTDVRWSTRNGMTFSRKPVEGKLAFMFPGEGSQYLGMFSDLALYFDEVRNWFDFWRGLYDNVPGESRTDILFPPQSEQTQQRLIELEACLHDMDIGSEAVFVAGQAIHALLKTLGIQAEAMIGHSSGESSAFVASGAIGSGNSDQLADFIRGLNKVYQKILKEGKIHTGALLAVGALSRLIVDKQIADLNKNIVIAMDNCVNQLILFGDKDAIETLQESLIKAGGICMPLPFDRGYHTPLFSPVSEAFLSYYDKVGLKAPRVPMYSCASADLFPDDPQAVKKLAAAQWSTMVRFSETVKKMYSDGFRYFVEVGPSGNLCSFVNDILAGEEYLSIATDLRRKSSLEQFLTAVSHLYVNAKEIQLERLFDFRSFQDLDLETGFQSKSSGIQLANTMPVLHISDNDRTVLQKLLIIPEAMTSNAPPTGKMEDLKTQFHQDEVRVESRDNDRIMADYFDLMRTFLDQQSMVLANWESSERGAHQKIAQESEYTPFLSSITELDDNHMAGDCRLSVYEDEFLKDHVLSGAVSESEPDLMGLSCVPLMVSLEIMAEACALLAGSPAVKIIKNVKTFGWIALDDGELTLNVRAKLIDSDTKTYQAELFNAGAMAVSAEFAFNLDWHADRVPALKETLSYRWKGSELYFIGMFHGPIFQSIHEINGWNDQGIEARLSEVSLDGFFDKTETPRLVINPVLLDAIGQLSAYWIAQQVGTDFNCFPSTIECIELYTQCPQNMEGLTLRAMQQPLGPDISSIEAPRVWQFECMDRAGEPLFRVTNLINIYFPVPNRFYEFRRNPLNGWLGKLCSIPGNKDIILWQLPHLSEKFCMQSDRIFLRILAHALLSFHERDEWRKLKTNIRHQREWLLGRACIKEAVRFRIFQETGHLLYPADIIVLHDEQGNPCVDGWWRDNLIQPPEVSLSHDRQISLAAAGPPNHPVGVDVEHIEEIRHPEFIEDSMTGSEKESLRRFSEDTLPEKILRIWCAKEAAAKYSGLGFQGNPEKFEVSFTDDHWELAHVRCAGTLVEVIVHCENEMMVALAARHSR